MTSRNVVSVMMEHTWMIPHKHVSHVQWEQKNVQAKQPLSPAYQDTRNLVIPSSALLVPPTVYLAPFQLLTVPTAVKGTI